MSSSPAHTNTAFSQRVWLFTLFAAEGIPSALVTYVAILIFLQQGTTPAVATVQASMLWLPWILKSWLRSWIRRAGHFRLSLRILEFSLSVSIIALAFILANAPEWTCVALWVVSFLTAGHTLTARMYYERMLRPRLQRIFNSTRLLASQIAVVITYGMMIIAAGVLQIYFRQHSLSYSWSFTCYLLGGVILALTIINAHILQPTHVNSTYSTNTIGGSFLSEYHITQRIRARQHWWRHLLIVFFALMPQGLMFHTRVFFLMDKEMNGGLACTLQEIGFAQGTIGVIAFWIGIVVGRSLLNYIPFQRLFWPMICALGFSPLIYLFMTIEAPTSLATLCIATFQSQLLFGFGLHGCWDSIRYISSERYRNTTNQLYIPLVSMSMFIPMAFSGYILEHLSYHSFFAIATICAPLSWILISFIKKGINQ